MRRALPLVLAALSLLAMEWARRAHPVAGFFVSLAMLLAAMVFLGWVTRGTREIQDYLVLRALQHLGESFALDLVAAGLGRRGTIYVRLGRLEEEGLIASREEPQAPGHHAPLAQELGLVGLPRRLYRLTPAGQTWCCGFAARLAARGSATGAPPPAPLTPKEP